MTDHTPPEAPVTIQRMTVQNLMKIKFVEITPDGNPVVLGGKNRAGKSCVLAAIRFLIEGKQAHSEQPVRDGADEAFLEAVLTGNLRISRTIKSDGTTTLKVTSGHGKSKMRYTRGQAFLDEMKGALTFDPLEFAKMDPYGQREMLLKAVGLDFADLDRQRTALYANRTNVNRHAKTLKSQTEASPVHQDAPESLVVVADLVDELERRQEHNRAIDAEQSVQRGRVRIADECLDYVKTLQRNVDGLQKKVAAACTELAEAKEGHLIAYRDATREAQRVHALASENTQKIQTQIADAEGINAKVRANEARRKLHAARIKAEADVDVFTSNIARIDAEKAAALQAAKMPVPGLAVSDTGVTFEGHPLSQCAASERLRVGVATAIALHPHLHVLVIQEGSLLDKDSKRMIAKMAADADMQTWMEVVGEEDENAIILEDGAIRGQAIANPAG